MSTGLKSFQRSADSNISSSVCRTGTCQSEQSSMETSFQLRSVTAVGPAYLTKPASRSVESQAPQVAQDQVAFENTRALTTALQDSPVVRDDVVRRATELVGDVNYPPPETIRMISHLLAIQIQSDGESTS